MNSHVSYEEMMTFLRLRQLVRTSYSHLSTMSLQSHHSLQIIFSMAEHLSTEPMDIDIEARSKHGSQLLEQCWNRWSSEYLLELRDFHARVQTKTQSCIYPISVGDIVIIQEPKQPCAT